MIIDRIRFQNKEGLIDHSLSKPSDSGAEGKRFKPTQLANHYILFINELREVVPTHCDWSILHFNALSPSCPHLNRKYRYERIFIAAHSLVPPQGRRRSACNQPSVYLSGFLSTETKEIRNTSSIALTGVNLTASSIYSGRD